MAQQRDGDDLPDAPRENYTLVGCIDPGTHSKLGANHAGIFVVRRPSDQRRLVEKRLRLESDDRPLTEILVLRRLRHPYILEYVDGYVADADDASTVQPAPRRRTATKQAQRVVRGRRARLYTEYCNGGALRHLKQRMDQECRRLIEANDALDVRNKPAEAAAAAPRLPEAFLWHVFICMARALYYLATGRREAYGARRRRGWQSLVHRDLNARNIFLRKNTASPERLRRLQRQRQRQLQQEQRRQQPQPQQQGTGTNASATAVVVDPNAEAEAIARFAAAAGYPDPVLGDWGNAGAAPDQMRYAEDFAGDVAPPSPGSKSSQPAGVLPAWDGQWDVTQLGEVMAYLCTNSLRRRLAPVEAPAAAAGAVLGAPDSGPPYGSTYYSRALVQAVGEAQNAFGARHPDAYQLLRRLVQLYRSAGPPAFEPLPPWAASRRRRLYTPVDSNNVDDDDQENAGRGGVGGGDPDDSSSSSSDGDDDDDDESRRRSRRPIDGAEVRALSALIAERTLRVPGSRNNCDECAVNVMVKFRQTDFGNIDVHDNSIDGLLGTAAPSTTS